MQPPRKKKKRRENATSVQSISFKPPLPDSSGSEPASPGPRRPHVRDLGTCSPCALPFHQLGRQKIHINIQILKKKLTQLKPKAPGAGISIRMAWRCLRPEAALARGVCGGTGAQEKCKPRR